MSLVNLQGTSLFGAGSEWFWSMLQFVIVAATLVGLYRQLRLQSSQRAVEQLDSYDHDWTSERMSRYKLEILVALRDGIAPANVPDAAATMITNFWEKIGTLVRKRHLDAKVLWEGNGNDGQLWWATLRPWAERRRTEIGDPKVFEHFEWLAERMTEMDRRAGTIGLSEGWIASSLNGRIVVLRDAIRIEQTLRTFVLAPPDPGSTGDSPTPSMPGHEAS
jgi:hypothetical protein